MAHLDTYELARTVIQKLMAGLPSGSYLVISDSTATSEAIIETIRIWNEVGRPLYHLRSIDEITGFFDGLELVEPGVVPVAQWRPWPGDTVSADDYYGGVARKP